jgi:hypothetical protein
VRHDLGAVSGQLQLQELLGPFLHVLLQVPTDEKWST